MLSQPFKKQSSAILRSLKAIGQDTDSSIGKNWLCVHNNKTHLRMVGYPSSKSGTQLHRTNPTFRSPLGPREDHGDEISTTQASIIPAPIPVQSRSTASTSWPYQQRHRYSTYPYQNYDILKRIFAKRRGYFMAVNLPPLPDVAQVSTNVWRILGGNPSKFTLQGTNTYLLGSGSQRILLDTAQGMPIWKSNLQKAISSDSTSDIQIQTCLLTHWHHDHICGIADLRSLYPDVKVLKHLNSSYDPDGNLTNETVYDIDDGQRFSVPVADGQVFEIQALYCPGHAKDHMAFLVTKSNDPSEIGSIFTADNVLGHGTAVFEDLAQYMSSLALMRTKVEELAKSKQARAFPGHGEVILDATEKLTEYITHRKMREEEALNVLTFGTTTKPGKPRTVSPAGFPESVPPPESGVGSEVVMGKEWESMEMVKVIYRKYPENLWQPAEYGLLQVLDKLKGEGRVVKTDDSKWKVVGDPKKIAMNGRSGRSRSGSPAGKL